MIMSNWSELEFEAGYTLTLWCEKHENDTAALYQAYHDLDTNVIVFIYKMDGDTYTEVLPYVECPPQYKYTSVCNEPRSE